MSVLASAPAGQAARKAYAICSKQTHALCASASASAFVYQDVSDANCIIKNGNSRSAPPLTDRQAARS